MLCGIIRIASIMSTVIAVSDMLLCKHFYSFTFYFYGEGHDKIAADGRVG